jgi:hypothetical protein
MIWALILTSSIWLGCELTSILSPPYWDQLTILSCGIPFGFTLSTWAFFFIRIFRALDRITGVIGSLAMFAISAALRHRSRKTFRVRPLRPEFLILLFVLSALYFKLTDVSMLKDGTGSSGTTYSDLPFHLALVSSFAYGANSGRGGFQTPFYLGEKLCYPIIPDLHSAVLVGCGGASLRISVALPTMALLYAMTFAVHALAAQFSSLRFVPELAVVSWLLASGVGWKYVFSSEVRHDPNANLVHAFGPHGYTFWIHSLVHYLLPQRSGMFSTPFNVQIVSLLFDAVENGL